MMDFRTETQLRQEIADAWKLVDQYKSADALEAADKRIAELEAELQKRAKQIGVACMTHDLIHSLACGRCLTEAERKLDVARKAMTKAATLECNGVIRAALAQIGGNDAGS